MNQIVMSIYCGKDQSTVRQTLPYFSNVIRVEQIVAFYFVTGLQVCSPTCGSFRVFPPIISGAMTWTRAGNWLQRWTNWKDCWPGEILNVASTWQMFSINFLTYPKRTVSTVLRSARVKTPKTMPYPYLTTTKASGGWTPVRLLKQPSPPLWKKSSAPSPRTRTVVAARRWSGKRNQKKPEPSPRNRWRCSRISRAVKPSRNHVKTGRGWEKNEITTTNEGVNCVLRMKRVGSVGRGAEDTIRINCSWWSLHERLQHCNTYHNSKWWWW